MTRPSSPLPTPRPFLMSDDLSPDALARTSPGLARVRMELARPGGIGAEFDNRASRPHTVRSART